MELKSLKREIENEIKKASNLKQLDEIFKNYLGKGGKISQIFSSLKEMKKEERIKLGKKANLLKQFFEKEIKKKAEELKEKERAEAFKKEKIDVTAPGKKITFGRLHPLTQVQRKVEEIFQSMGFSVFEGPEIEDEWYNFDSLNIPKDHPARDLWNTFYLKNKKFLLRTHTSPDQVRYMEKNNPPLRIIVPGRVFRREATDASHEINFYHLEGLMVGKDVSLANFKAIISEFFKRFFERKIEMRLIPSFFPFVEPGFQVDIICLNCQGRGCPACSQEGWMEVMGAGMVHPQVFLNSRLNPKDWQGFAFGIGMDRLAMMKYKINDIRLFYSGDLRFLKQF